MASWAARLACSRRVLISAARSAAWRDHPRCARSPRQRLQPLLGCGHRRRQFGRPRIEFLGAGRRRLGSLDLLLPRGQGLLGLFGLTPDLGQPPLVGLHLLLQLADPLLARRLRGLQLLVARLGLAAGMLEAVQLVARDVQALVQGRELAGGLPLGCERGLELRGPLLQRPDPVLGGTQCLLGLGEAAVALDHHTPADDGCEQQEARDDQRRARPSR